MQTSAFAHYPVAVQYSYKIVRGLDKLILGKEEEEKSPAATKSELATVLNEKVLTDQNKKKAKSILKVAGIIAAAILLIDVISMIIYFAVNGIV